MLRLLFVACLLIFGCAAVQDDYEFRENFSRSTIKMAKLLARELIAYGQTGNETRALKTLTESLTHSGTIARTEVEHMDFEDQSFMCTICRSAANVVLEMVKTDGSDGNNLKDILVTMCGQLKILDGDVCQKLFDLNWPIWRHIITETKNLNEENICSVILQASKCVTKDPQYDWKIEVSPKGDKVGAPKPPAPQKGTGEDLVIVQISDIHYDPNYKVGSNAECSKPMCGSSDSGAPPDSTKAAGKWSDYRNCDVPWHLLQATLEQIKNEHKKIDFIYYTGDIVDHSVWRTTREGNTNSMKQIYGEIKKTFGDVQVYPVIGNHESQPLNQFAPPSAPEKISTKWLYELLAQEWAKWIPDASAQATIKTGGYYTVLARKGFRIITINNNDCYTFNFWILHDPGYLAKQLQWLHDTLLDAEKAGEHVHILAHVPSGAGSCLNTWSREFRRIVERFHHIIGGIFNGHTHKDEFAVIFSTGKPQHAINVAWNGGSVTPYNYVNPNYRVYKVEPTTYQVVDHDTWIYNLTEANLTPHKVPSWYKEYSFREAFFLKDLSPASLDKLLFQYSINHELLKKYWHYKVKSGDPSLKEGCNHACLLRHLCEAATSQHNDQERCEQLKVDYQRTLEGLPPIYGNASYLKYSVALALFSLLSTIMFI